MINVKEYQEYMLSALKEIMAVDSPTGFSAKINEKLVKMLKEMGHVCVETNKRLVKVSVKGKSDEKKIAISAHVDTLGAMVRSVGSDGKIRFTRLGGPTLATFDGEYCKIYADGGKVYTGTFLSDSPSCHVYKDASTLERNENTMYVRLDEEVASAKDVENLGIRTGSVIALDTKTTVTESGFENASPPILYGESRFDSRHFPAHGTGHSYGKALQNRNKMLLLSEPVQKFYPQ